MIKDYYLLLFSYTIILYMAVFNSCVKLSNGTSVLCFSTADAKAISAISRTSAFQVRHFLSTPLLVEIKMGKHD